MLGPRVAFVASLGRRLSFEDFFLISVLQCSCVSSECCSQQRGGGQGGQFIAQRCLLLECQRLLTVASHVRSGSSFGPDASCQATTSGASGTGLKYSNAL